MELDITAKDIRRPEGKLSWGPTVTGNCITSPAVLYPNCVQNDSRDEEPSVMSCAAPIELEGTTIGGLWKLGFESGGHGMQPFCFRAAVLCNPADEDGDDDAAADPFGSSAVFVSETPPRIVHGKSGCRADQDLDSMPWTRHSKVALSRHHAAAFNGRKAGAMESAAAQRIQRCWLKNAAGRRVKAQEALRLQMYAS